MTGPTARRSGRGRVVDVAGAGAAVVARRVVLPAVVPDRVRPDQQPEHGTAGGEAADEPAPEPIRSSLWRVVMELGHRSASLHSGGEHDRHRNCQERGEAAGDEAEPRCAETGDDAEGRHRQMVERVLDGWRSSGS